MNQLNIGSLYDPTQISSENKFEAIEAGSGEAMIVNIEPKEPSNGGLMFGFQFTIIDGQFAGRNLFLNACVQHSNPKTEQIAREQIAQIQAACGCHGAHDLSQVINVPMQIKWNKKFSEYHQDFENNITSFKPVERAAMQQHQPQQQAQQQQQAPAWAKK